MRKFAIAGCLVALLTGAALLTAQEMPKMPEPAKEHAWLKQLEGEWVSDIQAFMPGQPPQKLQGSESARMIGGFWLLAENKGNFQGVPYTGILTLGYDPEKKQYVGTWVDSMQSTLWRYEGTVDEAGKTLTLSTEGPCPMAPGKLFKFKEVIEIKDKDHHVFTSSMMGEDGKWVTSMIANYRRKN